MPIDRGVGERCNNWYDPYYYSCSPENNLEGPVNSNVADLKVTRGGGKGSGPYACRSTAPLADPPVKRSRETGFRVVRRL